MYPHCRHCAWGSEHHPDEAAGHATRCTSGCGHRDDACSETEHGADHRHRCIHPDQWPHGHHLCACGQFWTNEPTDLLELLEAM